MRRRGTGGARGRSRGSDTGQEEGRVERACLDVHPEGGKELAEGGAVMLAPEMAEDGDDEEAAAQLEPEAVKKVGVKIIAHVYGAQYTM